MFKPSPRPSLSKAMQMEIASACSLCIRLQVRCCGRSGFTPRPAPCTWPPPSSRVPGADARPRPLSVLWAEGCWGRRTGAQGLSKAGSWIQASDAMVMVAIVTQLCMPTRICCGFRRLEPAERGSGQNPAPSSEGHGLSGGCPHLPLLPLPLPSVSSLHTVMASSLG